MPLFLANLFVFLLVCLYTMRMEFLRPQEFPLHFNLLLTTLIVPLLCKEKCRARLCHAYSCCNKSDVRAHYFYYCCKCIPNLIP